MLIKIYPVEKAALPRISTTILHNTGRCGSTMCCMALSQVPGLRVMEEPIALFNLKYFFHIGKFGVENYKQMIRSIIKIQVEFLAALAALYVVTLVSLSTNSPCL